MIPELLQQLHDANSLPSQIARISAIIQAS